MFLILAAGCVAPEERIEEPVENITENITEEAEEEIIEEEAEEIEEPGEVVEEINETIEFNETIDEEPEEIEEEIEGTFFGGGRYVLILDDIVWYGDKSCAAVTIAYSNGTSIKRDVMCPRTDYYWTDSAGHRFRFKVIETAAGYTGEAWANIIIYG